MWSPPGPQPDVRDAAAVVRHAATGSGTWERLTFGHSRPGCRPRWRRTNPGVRS
ncbi:hypothetical protein [Ornithinimicrobium kibberense]|uniref:hypothetical protein n=1 Tax=Ornithinimicrobium kibberense TaxID=282060 RepID=UPI0036216004